MTHGISFETVSLNWGAAHGTRRRNVASSASLLERNLERSKNLKKGIGHIGYVLGPNWCGLQRSSQTCCSYAVQDARSKCLRKMYLSPPEDLRDATTLATTGYAAILTAQGSSAQEPMLFVGRRLSRRSGLFRSPRKSFKS